MGKKSHRSKNCSSNNKEAAPTPETTTSPVDVARSNGSGANRNDGEDFQIAQVQDLKGRPDLIDRLVTIKTKFPDEHIIVGNITL